MTSSPRSLSDYIAQHLEENADEIVEEWIEWVQERVGTRTINALPKKALRNHIPPVVHSLARYLRSPLEAMRSEMLGHLELHGQIRREQGYDLPELLAELDGLANLLTQSITEALKSYPGEASTVEVVEVLSRVAGGTRAIGLVTVGTYRSSESAQRQELARRLEEFARAVTHELRNPLNTLSLGLQILKSEPDPERRREQIEMMQSSLKRTTELLDDIRVLAMAEGARRGRPMASLQVALQNVLDELQASAAAQGVDLQVAEDLPFLHVDSVVAQISLINVIGNAVKYSDPSKEERWIRISARLLDSEVSTARCEITVEDNGIGIPGEMEPRVFQRSFRAHPEHAEGTGLGLTITRQILLERGGSIELDTLEGRGTRVVFTLTALDSSATGAWGDDERPSDLMHRNAEGCLEEEVEDRLARGEGDETGDRC